MCCSVKVSFSNTVEWVALLALRGTTHLAMPQRGDYRIMRPQWRGTGILEAWCRLLVLMTENLPLRKWRPSCYMNCTRPSRCSRNGVMDLLMASGSRRLAGGHFTRVHCAAALVKCGLRLLRCCEALLRCTRTYSLHSRHNSSFDW